MFVNIYIYIYIYIWYNSRFGGQIKGQFRRTTRPTTDEYQTRASSSEKTSNKFYVPPASYTMSKKEKQQLGKVHGIKVPDGYASNISRGVDVDRGKISGLKSHDCHILMQELLAFAIRGLLPDNVTSVLFDLCAYFRVINEKVL
jgi:hypothetical protein